jgi:DNA modification methylase
MRNHLKEGEVTYDPFLGSGTAIIAAEKTGTICYGMEIEPRYVDVAVKRWENHTGKKAERIEQ